MSASAEAVPATAAARSTSPSALRFEGVSKRFSTGTLALDAIDLTVDAGEFVSVVGPSGCGKSTLLRLASGLSQATAGAVVTGDVRVSYVFQDPTLLPWRTVLGNVELVGELAKLPRSERREKALRIIKLVGLEGFERQRPGQLSGGMQMRVSLARALLLDPGLFLFDEPFGALDEMTRERLGDELQQLFHSRRFAGLFITHSVAEAVFLSTRVVVMSARPGQIVADVEIPFDYPRSTELRFTPEFAKMTGVVSAALRRKGKGELT
ncbi:ABC transporter ATP-binding protein [Actinopolymorpha alba]|uniref:ABC transporter ATP-binding protein n=1 Tax=Actinopolymorpha alba TaxID=533267 RepID=UPI0003A13C45|nr:ABC transporter ATP-binding protein [Actinopolymorpha alba]